MRNLTKEPKLATVNPTEKAKNIENSIENNSKGFFLIRTKKPNNFNLSKRNTVNINR